MRELSIFLDESGDFGCIKEGSPFYILSLVFHDQKDSIDEPLEHLHREMQNSGLDVKHAIHCSPLVRREFPYEYMDIVERRKVFKLLMNFHRLSPTTFKEFVFDKREAGCGIGLEEKMASALSGFLVDQRQYFDGWDRVVIYYDNGQSEITNLVNEVLSGIIRSEVRKIVPNDYSLFQVADLLCTLFLAEAKMNARQVGLSKSESSFFSSGGVTAEKMLKKEYLRQVRRKSFDS